jgi:hypothetical protein
MTEYPKIVDVDCAICGQAVSIIIEEEGPTVQPTVLAGCEHFYQREKENMKPKKPRSLEEMRELLLDLSYEFPDWNIPYEKAPTISAELFLDLVSRLMECEERLEQLEDEQ